MNEYPKTHLMEQGTDEWFAVKLGKVSASNFGQAIAGGAGKTKATLMRKLIAERMTGIPEQSYKNGLMERGNEVEPEARDYYEAINDCIVSQVGFVEFSEDVGVSPDGMVGDDGLLEIKCPNSATHIEYILSNKLPSVYKPQVQGQLWVTGRKWCDFVSYDPRITKRPYWHIRIDRDEDYITELSGKINTFITDMKQLIEKITGDSPY